MGQVLWGKGRFRRLLAVHFASGNCFPAERSSWAVAAAVAMAEGCHDWMGGRSFPCCGTELWGHIGADRLLQVVSLAAFLGCMWVVKRWLYCFLVLFFSLFAHKLFSNITVISDWWDMGSGFRSRFELQRLQGDIRTYISDLCHLVLFLIFYICQDVHVNS